MMPQSNSKYYCEIHGCNPTHMTLENIVPKLDDDRLLLLEGLVTVREPTTVEQVLIPKEV